MINAGLYFEIIFIVLVLVVIQTNFGAWRAQAFVVVTL
jgi:hypothetical protein